MEHTNQSVYSCGSADSLDRPQYECGKAIGSLNGARKAGSSKAAENLDEASEDSENTTRNTHKAACHQLSSDKQTAFGSLFSAYFSITG